MFDRMSPLMALLVNTLIVVCMVAWCGITVVHNLSAMVFTLGIVTTMAPWAVDAWMEG
jgi:hypothetical protein